MARSLASFQSTLPVWGATEEWDYAEGWVLFQSTLPVWGATFSRFSKYLTQAFQSTLPVWGATAVLLDLYGVRTISIHAPRVGSDCTMM